MARRKTSAPEMPTTAAAADQNDAAVITDSTAAPVWEYPYVVVAVDCGSRAFGMAKFRVDPTDFPDSYLLLDYRQVRIQAKIRGLGERLALIRNAASDFIDALGSRGAVIIEGPIPTGKNGWHAAVVAGAATAPIREIAWSRYGLEVDVVAWSSWKSRLGLPLHEEGDAVRDYVNRAYGLGLGVKDEDVADAIALGEAACREIVDVGSVSAWRRARAAADAKARAARAAKRERKAAKAAATARR